MEIPVIDDSIVSEGDEQFMVTFTVFTPDVETGVPNISYVTIIDNDSTCSLSMILVLKIIVIINYLLVMPFIINYLYPFQCLHLNLVTPQALLVQLQEEWQEQW